MKALFFIISIHEKRKGHKAMLGEKLMTLRKKYGYSQQELADKLSVSRQTISNWECGQGAPGLDKAQELAEIYDISLDDLAGNNVEIIAKGAKAKDCHVLKRLVGKTVRLEYSDMEQLLDSMEKGFSGKMEVLEVNDTWIRVAYERIKGDSRSEKERVIKLIETGAVDGFEIVEEEA